MELSELEEEGSPNPNRASKGTKRGVRHYFWQVRAEMRD